MTNYEVFEQYAVEDSQSTSSTVSATVAGKSPASDYYLLRSVKCQLLPWAVVGKQGFYAVFYPTLAQAREFCEKRGTIVKGGVT